MRPELSVTHTCRKFDKVLEWAESRYVNWSNGRMTVIDGHIVDYSSLGPPPLSSPANWDWDADEVAH